MMVEALGCLGPKMIADCTRGHGRAEVPLYEDFSRGGEDEEGLNHCCLGGCRGLSVSCVLCVVC